MERISDGAADELFAQLLEGASMRTDRARSLAERTPDHVRDRLAGLLRDRYTPHYPPRADRPSGDDAPGQADASALRVRVGERRVCSATTGVVEVSAEASASVVVSLRAGVVTLQLAVAPRGGLLWRAGSESGGVPAAVPVVVLEPDDGHAGEERPGTHRRATLVDTVAPGRVHTAADRLTEHVDQLLHRTGDPREPDKRKLRRDLQHALTAALAGYEH